MRCLGPAEEYPRILSDLRGIWQAQIEPIGEGTGQGNQEGEFDPSVALGNLFKRVDALEADQESLDGLKNKGGEVKRFHFLGFTDGVFGDFFGKLRNKSSWTFSL